VFAYNVSWVQFAINPVVPKNLRRKSFLELDDMTKRCVSCSVMNAGWSYSLLLLGYLQTCSFYVALEPQGIEVWSLDQ
jgi:hypothetical protein